MEHKKIVAKMEKERIKRRQVNWKAKNIMVIILRQTRRKDMGRGEE